MFISERPLYSLALFSNFICTCTTSKRYKFASKRTLDYFPKKYPEYANNWLVSPIAVRAETRADKGWAVKRARPSQNVWCSGLWLCLKMSLVFDFGQGLRCGLSISHCRCHWIMASQFVFLPFFLVPLCWYAVSERQMLLFFAGGLVGLDKHLFQRVSVITSLTLLNLYWIIFSF